LIDAGDRLKEMLAHSSLILVGKNPSGLARFVNDVCPTQSFSALLPVNLSASRLSMRLAKSAKQDKLSLTADVFFASMYAHIKKKRSG